VDATVSGNNMRQKKASIFQRTWIFLVGCVLMLGSTAFAPAILAQDGPRTDDPKRWQAVAPGRVEPWSGEIKIAAPVIAAIGEILVKPTDKVFAGELLIRLQDEEVRARLATAEAQVAMRRRARNDQTASNRVIDRRRSEDTVADAERAVVEARAAIDTASIARRGGKGSDGDVEKARTAYARALDRLKRDRNELRKLLDDGGVPLPAAVDGQLNVARTELAGAEAALEKLMIRAPIDGTVLQINGRAGELASPSATQPLLVLGNVSKLRVRAEVDERDFGDIKIGQVALVRTNAFRGREVAGKVASIAPMVDAGRINRGQRGVTDVNVVEVMVDLVEPGPLAVGMKVDVYFRPEGAPTQ
jgi:HlyD family secretion protein